MGSRRPPQTRTVPPNQGTGAHRLFAKKQEGCRAKPGSLMTACNRN